MRGRSIYFTADEIVAMEKFFNDFDIYFLQKSIRKCMNIFYIIECG